MRQTFPRLAAMTAALALTVACATHASAADPSDDADRPEDAVIIETLQSQGVDLTQPHLVEFLFSFTTAQPARTLGKTLAGEGFKSQVETVGAGQDVLLLARKRVVLSAEAMAALRERFETLARSTGGQYEGWGIP